MHYDGQHLYKQHEKKLKPVTQYTVIGEFPKCYSYLTMNVDIHPNCPVEWKSR
jgi:hypothetical protein